MVATLFWGFFRLSGGNRNAPWSRLTNADRCQARPVVFRADPHKFRRRHFWERVEPHSFFLLRRSSFRLRGTEPSAEDSATNACLRRGSGRQAGQPWLYALASKGGSCLDSLAFGEGIINRALVESVHPIGHRCHPTGRLSGLNSPAQSEIIGRVSTRGS